MVSLEVHVEELLLAEGFITMATGIRLFSSMGPFVHDHVPLLARTGKKDSCKWIQKSKFSAKMRPKFYG